MTRRLFVRPALGIALTLTLAACDSKPAPSAPPAAPAPAPSGADPFVQLISRTNEMIQLLKDNKADPNKALQELAAYQEKHKAEIESLRQQVGEMMQKDPMKVAAGSSIYGIKSAELDVLTKELATRAKPK